MLGVRVMHVLARTRRAALTVCFDTLLSAIVATASPVMARAAHRPEPEPVPVSKSAGHFANWVTSSSDSHGMPFVIIDKKNAQVAVYYPDGRLRGAAPALLGLAVGDDTVPGIGQRKLSSIAPAERTTPAGRFTASLGNDLGKKNVLWVDYDDAISLHRVITSNRKERRLQRLATASILDNRISLGCINVPATFFDTVVEPTFTGTSGIVYILPDVRSIQAVFPAYGAAE
jgi:hypothetical protein